MRRVVQPGAPDPARLVACDGHVTELGFALAPGRTLREALTSPLVAAGFAGGTLRFAGASLGPFAYVVPHPAPDASHVAYFSPARMPAGVARVEVATVTFGWRDGAPFVHCHGLWTEASGERRGGHVLPDETIVTAPCEVRAWAFADVAIRAEHDRETNFPLFRPEPHDAAPRGRPAVCARIRPNQEVHLALERICAARGLRSARVRGSLGSLVGAVFEDGRTVPDVATEVLVLEGAVADGIARLDMAVIDMRGEVHTGRLARGENAVCITFELVVEAAG